MPSDLPSDLPLDGPGEQPDSPTEPRPIAYAGPPGPPGQPGGPAEPQPPVYSGPPDRPAHVTSAESQPPTSVRSSDQPDEPTPYEPQPPVYPGPPDPGLQPERTVLAWVRTLLALAICSVLFLRWVPVYGPAALIPPALALLGGLVIYLSRGRTERRGVLAITMGRADPPVGAILGLTALVIAIGIGAIAVI